MSRSGYTDDHDDPLAHGRWRQAVRRALEGRRGQAFLRVLAKALDDMPDKRLWPHNFATPDGEFCALGVAGVAMGVRMDDLGDDDDCDPKQVGRRFGIARAMAAEIMYLNDEYFDSQYKWVKVEICGPVRPNWPDWGLHTRDVRIHNDQHAEDRWKAMRKWVAEQIGEGVRA